MAWVNITILALGLGAFLVLALNAFMQEPDGESARKAVIWLSGALGGAAISLTLLQAVGKIGRFAF